MSYFNDMFGPGSKSRVFVWRVNVHGDIVVEREGEPGHFATPSASNMRAMAQKEIDRVNGGPRPPAPYSFWNGAGRYRDVVELLNSTGKPHSRGYAEAMVQCGGHGVIGWSAEGWVLTTLGRELDEGFDASYRARTMSDTLFGAERIRAAREKQDGES